MSRSDRELLELAARAAGWHVVGWNDQSGVEVAVLGDGTHFQPLHENGITDCMGDALRLAVKLRIGLDHNRAGDQSRYVAADRPGCEGCFYPVCCVEDEFDELHRDAATRLAVVRAAAEIGASK